MNFQSCRDLSISVESMHALVGANNSGKSTILRAMNFLFNPSTRNLSNESFWSADTDLEIRVEAIFADLNSYENEVLGPYLRPDGTFHMARSAKVVGDDGSMEDGGVNIVIKHHYRVPVPNVLWLRSDEINQVNVAKWWKKKNELMVGGISFLEFLESDTKPGVGIWKTKASEFVAAHFDKIPQTEKWIDNPQGYANVLKSTLPFFVLISALSDITDESKGTKNSPFGQLLLAILDSVKDEKKEELDTILSEVSKKMNRIGGADRVQSITDTEHELNNYLGTIFSDTDLEIEFETPTLESLVRTPQIYVDDGFRNKVENKGHGLQRAVVFSIIRMYAELMTEDKRRGLVLAIEEPELYMHPQAQRTIRKALRKIADGGDQVIFSTHSSLLVEVEYFDEIIHLQSTKSHAGVLGPPVSNAQQMPMQPMIDDQMLRYPRTAESVTSESIRERNAHAYNPNRNEGFFASRVILVEGLTEQYSLPIYAAAMGIDFDLLGISVIECGGKFSIDRLYRVFNELAIPCYVMFDYDHGKSDSEKISRKLLEFLGLDTDVPGSVLVTDRVTCFPTNWEKDLAMEIPDLAVLSEKAKSEVGPSKPLIARYVAKELASRQPVFVPPSIAAAITAATKVEWPGSCLRSTN